MDFSDKIRCVSACIDPPSKTLLKNAKVQMCKRIPALNPIYNFNGSCTFGCEEGMNVLARSGIPSIRCESPASGGPPEWVKVGDTGTCTSDLCTLENERDNVIDVQSFAKRLWKNMYVPANVDQPKTDMLMNWNECKDSDHKFQGTQTFRIGCCQKEIETANGTIITSGLFPLTSSGTCPRKDNWIKHMEEFDFYHCVKVKQGSPYVYVALALVTIIAILSGGLVVLTKTLFGRKDIYKKIQQTKNKISILASSTAGRKLLTQLSGNYKTTNSFQRGIASAQEKHLSHAESAINSFEHIQMKAKLKRQSSHKMVTPLCALKDQQHVSIVQKHDPMVEVVSVHDAHVSVHDRANTESQTSSTVKNVPLLSFGPKRRDAGNIHQHKRMQTDIHPKDGLSRVKTLHEEAMRLRQKNAARTIQRNFRGKISKTRYIIAFISFRPLMKVRIPPS